MGRPKRKGLGADDSTPLTIRITADQKRRIRELAKDDMSLGDIVRTLMLAGEIAFTDPAGFAKSFAAVARDDLLEELGLPNSHPVERIETEILAAKVRRFDKANRSELAL